jgi:hypothetical protein
MKHLRKPRRWIIVAALAAAILLTWILFYPEHKLDAAAISPSVKSEIAKTGFKSVSGITTATFKNQYSLDGVVDTVDVRQKITAADELLTEKRSRRYAKFYFEENVGFHVGPFSVLRHTRSVLPIIAFLLPSEFWASSRMAAFTVQHVDTHFPDRPGSMLLAKVTYEDRYAGGELAQTERVQLRCAVGDVIRASSIDSRLPGFASRINCEEQPEPNGRVIAPKGSDSLVLENVKYTHLYVVDLGWSIAVEGERTFQLLGHTATETWKSELKSFTTASTTVAALK